MTGLTPGAILLETSPTSGRGGVGQWSVAVGQPRKTIPAPARTPIQEHTISSIRRLSPAVVAAAVLAVAWLALPAGAQTPSPSVSPSPSATPSPSPSATPAPAPVPSPTLPPPTTGIEIEVEVHTAAPLIGQIGDLVVYSIDLEVSEPVHDLVVTGSVPIEMDITSLPLNDRVEAMTSGQRGDQEDIVWVISSATPQNGVTLNWTARVTHPGDLVATAVFKAKAGAQATVATSDTFLAAPPEVATEGVARSPQVRGKVVRFVPVRVGATGNLLPRTGWSPAVPLGVAFACMISGALLIIISVRRPRLRWMVAALVALSVTAACSPDSNRSQSTPEVQPETGSAATPNENPKKAPRDRVLGTRITRDEPTAEPTEAPTGTSAGNSIAYRRVVTLDRSAREPQAQTARPSDNSLSFGWDEPTREVHRATSGVLLKGDQPSSMTVGLSWDSEGLSTNVRLENISSEPLRVKGSVVLEIRGAGGGVTTLESEPLDVTLAPGGGAVVSYRYLLPTGEYTISSGFQP